MGGIRNLESLFNPKTIAVVGASPTAGKISNIILKSLKHSSFSGKVYPINPRYKEVQGLKCFKSIADIGAQVDLAVFAIPAKTVPGALRDSEARLNVAVIVSGGFGETGEAGRALEKELKEIVSRTGVRVVGPNCMGIYDSFSGVDTFFIPEDRMKRPGKGGLSIVSQSGSFAVTAMDELAAEGAGAARIISYGNKADVNETDCLEFLIDDEQTTAVALYIESIEEGRRFVDVASRCAAKKPVMALKVGKSAVGMDAAHSHTGALAGRYEVYKAAFKKAGVIELSGYEDFLSACKALSVLKKTVAGRRVMIITDGGGMGVNIADACASLGLEVEPLPEKAKEQMSLLLPRFCSVSNPMDLTGSATDELFAEALEKTLDTDGYDLAIVAALWGPPALTDELPHLISEKAELADKPVIICSPGGVYTRAKTALFGKYGLPVFPSPESAARAASILCRGRRKA